MGVRNVMTSNVRAGAAVVHVSDSHDDEATGRQTVRDHRSCRSRFLRDGWSCQAQKLVHLAVRSSYPSSLGCLHDVIRVLFRGASPERTSTTALHARLCAADTTLGSWDGLAGAWDVRLTNVSLTDALGGSALHGRVVSKRKRCTHQLRHTGLAFLVAE